MNGEVKSYRLNEPMTWKEFKVLPDDIKVTYIKLLREKWGVPDSHIADMMKVNKATISIEMKRIGLSGERKPSGYKWDTEGFKAWAYGDSVEPVEVKEDVPEAVIEEPVAEAKHTSNSVNYEAAYKILMDELEKANVEIEILNADLEERNKEIHWLNGYKAAVEVIFGRGDL